MSVPVKMQLAAYTALVLGGSAALALASRGIDPASNLAVACATAAMWLPALVAGAVMLLSEGTLAGLGWKPGKPRWLAAGYLAPLIYGGGAFLVAALAGAGQFDFTRWANGAGEWGMAPLAANGLLIQMTVIILPALFMALGEEIGWRGFLAPRLALVGGFRGAVNFGALIWFAYHVPALLAGQYGPADLPLAFKLATFAVLIWSGSLFYTWLRLKSGSFWPAALSHAAHNTFIQMMFASGFAWNARTPWIAGEFGLATVLLMASVAIALYRASPVSPQPTRKAELPEIILPR